MHIGKSTKMVGRNKRNLNFVLFVISPTQEPMVGNDQNRLSVAQWSVELGYMRNEIFRAWYP
jgi:hypothetical protein